MTVWKHIFIIIFLSFVPIATYAQAQEKPFEPYDPQKLFHGIPPYDQSDFDDEMNFGIAKIKQSIEELNGVPYVKYSNSKGSLYIEQIISTVAKDSAHSALVKCTGKTKMSNDIEKNHHIRLEIRLSDNLSNDLGQVNKIIIDGCNGNLKGYKQNWKAGEIGIKIKGRDKDYRIFNKNLKPNIGLQVDF